MKLTKLVHSDDIEQEKVKELLVDRKRLLFAGIGPVEDESFWKAKGYVRLRYEEAQSRQG
jgi:hypothetical protein